MLSIRGEGAGRQEEHPARKKWVNTRWYLCKVGWKILDDANWPRAVQLGRRKPMRVQAAHRIPCIPQPAAGNSAARWISPALWFLTAPAKQQKHSQVNAFEDILMGFLILTTGLNREDAMDRSRWRKQIGMIDDHDELSGWMFLLVPAHLGCPGQIPQNHKMVVCVCVCSNPNKISYSGRYPRGNYWCKSWW